MALSDLLGTEAIFDGEGMLAPLPELGMQYSGEFAPSYRHLRRLHVRDGVPVCFSDVYLAEDLFKKHKAAFKKSAEAPYQMAEAMSGLLPAFTQLLLHCNKNVITDAVIAAEQAVSCIRAARLNVEINAKYVKDEFYAREMKDSYLTWENAISAIDAVLTYQVKL